MNCSSAPSYEYSGIVVADMWILGASETLHLRQLLRGYCGTAPRRPRSRHIIALYLYPTGAIRSVKILAGGFEHIGAIFLLGHPSRTRGPRCARTGQVDSHYQAAAGGAT